MLSADAAAGLAFSPGDVSVLQVCALYLPQARANVWRAATWPPLPPRDAPPAPPAFLQHLLIVAAFAKRRVLQTQAAMAAQRRAYGLVEMIKAVSHEVEVTEIIKRIISVAYDLLAADRVSVFLVDHDEQVRGGEGRESQQSTTTNK